jgi:F-type H+-transporting ATPase subunit alpha
VDREVVQIIDPGVLGGIVVRDGDQLYNVSLKSRIGEMRKALFEAVESENPSLVAPLKEAMQRFEAKGMVKEEIGEVVSVKDGIATISGLSSCMSQEMLDFSSGAKGLALNLEEGLIGAIILGEFKDVKQGDRVTGTGEIMSVPVGEAMIGRVVDSLGRAVDGKGVIKTDKKYPLERIAPGVMTRQPVDTPMQTGIKAIDALIPVGRGQRELILGDRQTGKTALAVDMIINQAGKDVICVYVAIGQKESKVARLVTKLEEVGAMDYTIVLTAGASEAAPMLYLAPYAGVTMAEYFADKGKDVLIIYDDLTKQAMAYREMSLLLRRPPGREAYPGDVFYLHSRLLERACNLNEENGGGSITAIPIIETQGNDSSAYIPTNVISITDGQIYLEPDLFYRGIRPAINVGASVSRVGGAAQIKPMKKVAGSLKLGLAQFRDLEAFAQFSSDLDAETKSQIDNGRRLTELLKQPQFRPVPVADQILAIFAVSNGFFSDYELSEIGQKEEKLIEFAHKTSPDFMAELASGKWADDSETRLRDLCTKFKDSRN